MFKVLRAFKTQFRSYRRIFMLAFFCMVGMNILTYSIPIGVRYITDHIFPVIDQPGKVAVLIRACLIMIAAGAVRGFFVYVMAYSFWFCSIAMGRDLRNALYDKLQRLGFSFYSKARTGDLMSRLTTDIEILRNFYAWVFEHRIQIACYFGIVLALLLWTDWRLALATYVFVPLVSFFIIHYSKKIRAAVSKRQIQAGLLNSVLQENITGIRVVKAYAMEEEEKSKFGRENDKMFGANLRVSLLQVYLQPILVFTSGIGTLVVLFYGGYLVMRGGMTLGSFMAFFSYLTITNWPIMMLAHNTNQMRQAEGAADRILEILRRPEHGIDNTGTLIVPLQGGLRFEDVTFGYDDEKDILHNINFTVEPGEKVAFFGLTGSGKSTLVSLIPRFYDPQRGLIRLDGRDIREYELTGLRRQIGAVLQETFLFSTTIRENIAFGCPDAGMDEVMAAAKSAQIHDFITSLPYGYDTIVGERGVGLSGGQKQRVAIARALLSNPRILILDDCTSSVDPETETAIQESLRRLMEGRTTLIIAQRISTLRLAERIIILDGGQIAASGSHEELLETSKLYREIYRTQMMEPEELPA
ncbi:MAG: ABC transporter ATP-binding protein [Bacillota bacterium]